MRVADQRVDRVQIACEGLGQPFMRLHDSIIQTHQSLPHRLDIALSGDYITSMEELLRTNDITLIPRARALLEDEGIDSFELDVNMSVLEGSIGILPRRLMVRTDDLNDAMRILRVNGVYFERG